VLVDGQIAEDRRVAEPRDAQAELAEIADKEQAE
jgi:hypothetical protein